MPTGIRISRPIIVNFFSMSVTSLPWSKKYMAMSDRKRHAQVKNWKNVARSGSQLWHSYHYTDCYALPFTTTCCRRAGKDPEASVLEANFATIQHPQHWIGEGTQNAVEQLPQELLSSRAGH